MQSQNPEKLEANQKIYFDDFLIKSYSAFLFLNSNNQIINRSRSYLELQDTENNITYKMFSDETGESLIEVEECVSGMDGDFCVGTEADSYYGPLFREIVSFLFENVLLSSQKYGNTLYVTYKDVFPTQ